MPQIDLADDSFVVGVPAVVAARLRDPAFWQGCWPDISLTPYHDRGAEGVRWHAGGAVVGTAELWLEPYRDGTLVHVFLRADPATAVAGRRLDRLRRRYVTSLKAGLFAVKDDIEAMRTVGTSPASDPDRWDGRGPHLRSEPSRRGVLALLAELSARQEPAPPTVGDGPTRVGDGPLRLVGVRRLDGGIATATHRLSVQTATGDEVGLVLKRYLPGDDTAGLEWDRLQFARRCAVQTPVPLLLDSDGRWFGTPALVMTALRGVVRYDHPDPKAWARRLGQALAAIHRTDLTPPLPAVVRRPSSLERSLTDGSWPTAVQPLVDRLRTLAPARPRVLCHGDYHPGNVLFDAGAVSGVVDWSAARLGPAASDVANCRAELSLVTDGELPDVFVEGYAEAAGEMPAHLALWDAVAGVSVTQWVPYVVAFNDLGAQVSAEGAKKRIGAFVDDAVARAG